VGMGHVYRCIRLAGLLSQENINCLFIMKKYPAGVEIVTSCGFNIELLDSFNSPKTDAEKIVAQARKLGAPVFIDLRTPKKDLVDHAKEHGVSTVIYEDVSQENLDTDLLINPSPLAVNEEKYLKGQNNTQYLLGVDYLVLDPGIQKNRRSIFSPDITRLFLCFGGADPCNISSRVLHILLTGSDGFKIILALGPAFNHHDDVEAIVRKKDKENRVSVVRGCNDLAQLQSQCQTAIIAGGTMVYESIALCIPALVLPSIDAEARNLLPLVEKGLVEGVHEDVAHVDDVYLSERIFHFLENVDMRRSLYNHQREMDLTGGAIRVVKHLNGLINLMEKVNK
jgi:spore coat polysaccharide biosynthesis predicted glycosyltransferase SpsG